MKKAFKFSKTKTAILENLIEFNDSLDSHVKDKILSDLKSEDGIQFLPYMLICLHSVCSYTNCLSSMTDELEFQELTEKLENEIFELIAQYYRGE